MARPIRTSARAMRTVTLLALLGAIGAMLILSATYNVESAGSTHHVSPDASMAGGGGGAAAVQQQLHAEHMRAWENGRSGRQRSDNLVPCCHLVAATRRQWQQRQQQ